MVIPDVADLLPDKAPAGAYDERWEQERQDLLTELRRAQQTGACDRTEELEGKVAEFMALPRPGGAGAPVPVEPRSRRSSQREGSDRVCPEKHCDGSGWILGDDDVAIACSCRGRTRRLDARTKRHAETYLALSLETPPLVHLPPPTKAAIERLTAERCKALDQGLGAWFVGDDSANAGASYIAGAAVAAKKRVITMSGYELAATMRAAAADDLSRLDHLLYERLAGCDLLVLLDLDQLVEGRDEPIDVTRGTGRKAVSSHLSAGGRERDHERLRELIAARVERALPLLVTSKLSPAQLGAAFERIGRLDLVDALIDAAKRGRADASEPAVHGRRVEALMSRLAAMTGEPLAA